MNEIDLWHEAENCEYADESKLKNIAYELYRLFEWSDYPTAEDDFDEIYSRIWEGESLTDILNKKEKHEESTSKENSSKENKDRQNM